MIVFYVFQIYLKFPKWDGVGKENEKELSLFINFILFDPMKTVC
jgi:hypothetical protein